MRLAVLVIVSILYISAIGCDKAPDRSAIVGKWTAKSALPAQYFMLQRHIEFFADGSFAYEADGDRGNVINYEIKGGQEIVFRAGDLNFTFKYSVSGSTLTFALRDGKVEYTKDIPSSPNTIKSP